MPEPRFIEGVLPRLLESTFGNPEEHMRERQLRNQRAQAGERRTQRTRVKEQLRFFDPHPFKRGAAAVGLALADVVPVVVQGDAAAATGNGRDQQLAAGTFIHRRGDQHL